jgi:hypothetical protein
MITGTQSVSTRAARKVTVARPLRASAECARSAPVMRTAGVVGAIASSAAVSRRASADT